MTEQPGVPSAADLDAVNAELELASKTAGANTTTTPMQLTPKEVASGVEIVSEPAVYSREGVLFDPEVHAAHEDGTPKTDSCGVFISKEHDYNPRTPNIPGGK